MQLSLTSRCRVAEWLSGESAPNGPWGDSQLVGRCSLMSSLQMLHYRGQRSMCTCGSQHSRSLLPGWLPALIAACAGLLSRTA